MGLLQRLAFPGVCGVCGVCGVYGVYGVYASVALIVLACGLFAAAGSRRPGGG
ncbi:hypothetical protein ABT189_43905 [Streptomyces sp900105755]|uniref:hypothetical protein n=1 Tax=Streptomyces sp. 900105755 TaxID=3154389 RepID=UPI00333235AC